jgi:hypothetical protein
MSAWKPVLALGLLLVGTTPAAADEPRRSIAVLEFRQEVSTFPDLGERMARRLTAKTSVTVMGPTAARHKAGAEVDAFVARCAGNARCVGALGKRLGVSEVILVGLTSLGDVIVQISRVDSESRQVLSTVGATLAATATLADDQVDEWLRKLLPAEVFRRYGYLQVRSNRDGAEVHLNARAVGRTPLPGRLRVPAPSTQNVRVSKPGYVDFRADLQVPPESTILVNADLPPVPPRVVPLYRRWWFWTALAAGAAVIAGTAAGIGMATRGGADTVPAVLRW